MSDPAKVLGEYKEREGLSQAQLGEKLGMSQAQVSRLLNGGCPTLEQALTAKRIVGIDVEAWPWSGAMARYLRQKRRAG